MGGAAEVRCLGILPVAALGSRGTHLTASSSCSNCSRAKSRPRWLAIPEVLAPDEQGFERQREAWKSKARSTKPDLPLPARRLVLSLMNLNLCRQTSILCDNDGSI